MGVRISISWQRSGTLSGSDPPSLVGSSWIWVGSKKFDDSEFGNLSQVGSEFFEFPLFVDREDSLKVILVEFQQKSILPETYRLTAAVKLTGRLPSFFLLFV